jgi:hypothetical protein
MRPAGWYEDVIIDLEGVKVPAQHRPTLRQHDHEQIVGHTTKVKVGKEGITVEGVFSGEKHHVDSVVVPASNNFQWQLSVGLNPTKTEYLERGKTTRVNGRKITGPLTIARESELSEVSFVALGADSETQVSIAASAAGRQSDGDAQAVVRWFENLNRQANLDECRRIRAALGMPPLAGIQARDFSGVGICEPYFGASGGGYRRKGTLQLPKVIRGTALRFGEVWAPGPAFDPTYRQTVAAGQRVIVFKGALDDALSQLSTRDALLRLCVDHDLSQELCHGLNSGLRLRLSDDRQRVLFRLPTDTVAAREAAHTILTSGRTGLSLNLVSEDTIELPDFPGYVGVAKAWIRDVSIVSQPRCPGCRLEL